MLKGIHAGLSLPLPAVAGRGWGEGQRRLRGRQTDTEQSRRRAHGHPANAAAGVVRLACPSPHPLPAPLRCAGRGSERPSRTCSSEVCPHWSLPIGPFGVRAVRGLSPSHFCRHSRAACWSIRNGARAAMIMRRRSIAAAGGLRSGQVQGAGRRAVCGTTMSRHARGNA